MAYGLATLIESPKSVSQRPILAGNSLESTDMHSIPYPLSRESRSSERKDSLGGGLVFCLLFWLFERQKQHILEPF